MTQSRGGPVGPGWSALAAVRPVLSGALIARQACHIARSCAGLVKSGPIVLQRNGLRWRRVASVSGKLASTAATISTTFLWVSSGGRTAGRSRKSGTLSLLRLIAVAPSDLSSALQQHLLIKFELVGPQPSWVLRG